MVALTTPPQTYNLGPVKPWVEAAAYDIGPKFGIKSIGGWRKTDPFPDHPTGHALDFMTSDRGVGDSLAAYVIANAKALGVKYVIWYRQVWTPDRGWHPYTSTSNPHTDHVHVTFNDAPGTAYTGGNRLAMSLTGGLASLGLSQENTCAWGVHLPNIGPIGGGEFCILSKVNVRIGLALLVMTGAVVVGLVGTVILVAYGMQRTGVADKASRVAGFVPGVGTAAKVGLNVAAKGSRKSQPKTEPNTEPKETTSE
jgi:hypothetical protein